MAETDFFAVADLTFGFMKTQIVNALATHAVADHLAQGPLSASEVAQAAGTHADTMRRLLNAAASLGLARVEADGRYASTAMLEVLREDAPMSLRAVAMMMGRPAHWLPWGLLPEAVRIGEGQASAALGCPLFDHMKSHPEEHVIFQKAMQNTTAIVQGEVVRLLDMDGVRSVADIGGGNGSLLCALAAAHPQIEGVVYDLEENVAIANAYIADVGLSGRLRAQGGDFFKAAPSADLYLLKYILHDWEDAACVNILKNCRAAIRPAGRLIVVELTLGEPGEPGFGPLGDMNMLAVTGARERTEKEYAALLDASGFNLKRAIPTMSPFTIYEAVAV